MDTKHNKKVNLPKSVLVGSMRYSIEDMSDDMHELANALGLCDKTQLTIHIYPKQALPKLWATLWHEVKHAMHEESAINMKYDEEEEYVSNMERIECSVFKDNPTLMKNLIKVLRGQDNNSSV